MALDAEAGTPKPGTVLLRDPPPEGAEAKSIVATLKVAPASKLTLILVCLRLVIGLPSTLVVGSTYCALRVPAVVDVKIIEAEGMDNSCVSLK